MILRKNLYGWKMEKVSHFLLLKKKANGLKSFLSMNLTHINILIMIVMWYKTSKFLSNSNSFDYFILIVMLIPVFTLPLSVWFDSIFCSNVKLGINLKKKIAFNGFCLQVCSSDFYFRILSRDKLKILLAVDSKSGKEYEMWETDDLAEIEHIRSEIIYSLNNGN